MDIDANVRVLGPLEVVVDGARVAVTSATQRRILAALVARRGDVVGSEQLADMVDVSLRALRTAISRTRAMVGDAVIVTVPEGYTLGDVLVDADRFEALLGQSRKREPEQAVVAFDSALLLWRGDPYGDHADAEWAMPEAARLAELQASAIEGRAEALLALGRYSDVVSAMTSHVTQHRLRDGPVELLMRGLAAQGRQTEALRCFREYRQNLIDETGLEPGVRLSGVDAKIATGWNDAAASAVNRSTPGTEDSAGNLRTPPTSFIGRDREVREVQDALGRHRLVTLIGAGGVGKTRLSVETALRSDQWSGGRWLVEFGSVERDGDVADVVARTLAVRQSGGLSSTESVVRWCELRTVLLVLDNCEHVLTSVARLVDSLLTESAAVTILATSREPLMVSGEHVVPVQPLALNPDEPAAGAAAELFIERARAELPTFDPEHHRDAIAAICRRLDGVPLALELAAARVRGLTAEGIASRLDERFRLLTGGRRTSSERHSTLRATVDWSYELLHEAERLVLEALSVFAGSFTLDDAVAMAGDELDEPDAIDAIAHLVDCSLVVRGDTPPEYRLLETIRVYARERLSSAGRTQLMGNRHVELMVSKAAHARNASAGPDENRVVVMVRAQVAEYGAAVHGAVASGDADVAVRIAEDVFITLSFWGDNSEPGTWMRDLLDAGVLAPEVAAVNRWIASHWYMFFGNDLDRSVELADEAVELDPRAAWARVMATFGAILGGRADDARHSATVAQELAQGSGERAGCFTALGGALLATNDVIGASRTAEEFVAWAEHRRFPSALGMALHLRGRTLAEGAPVEALETFERALQLVREQIPGCWNVDTLIRRSMMPLVARNHPGRASALALTVLRASVRHNETGNVVGVLALAATMLVGSGHLEAAARAVGSAGNTLLPPSEAAMLERTKRDLRVFLGDGYEPLVAEGARMPVIAVAQSVIDALDPPR